MKKRSLWSQHICYTLIRFPTLPEVEKGRREGLFPLLFLSLCSESRWATGAKYRQLRREQMEVHWQNGSGLHGRVASSPNLLVSVQGRLLQHMPGAEVWCLEDAPGTWEQQSSQRYKWSSSPTSGPELAFCQCCLWYNLGLTFYMYAPGCLLGFF